MKKIIVLILSLFLVSGCSGITTADKLELETYKSMYTDIFNATSFKTSSNYFSIGTSLTFLSEANYRYDVVIDAPKVAMYDVEILLIQDNGSLVFSQTMMPSVGIFEDKTYYMVPYQVNPKANFEKGFALNGISVSAPVRLKMAVSWKDALNKQYKEYFDFTLS